jgi:hypothetical protein
LRQQQIRHVDRFGWSPFDESLFPERLLNCPQLHHLLRVPGGFAAFWKEAKLPTESGPQQDTNRLAEGQLQSMIQMATSVVSKEASHAAQTLTTKSNEMDEMFSPWVSSNVNKFAPLSRHEKDYSGEVSTIDGSFHDVCLGEISPVSSGNVNRCSTAGLCERSSSRSFGTGYDSDLEGDDSRTPSRISRAKVVDDLQRNAIRPLRTQSAKDTRGSEASGRTSSTFEDMSEDEKFAQGIV